jgi:pilus assembly protein CpaF
MGLKDRLTQRGFIAARAGEADGAGSDPHAEELMTRLRRRLVDEIDVDELIALSPSQRRARLERIVGALVSSEGPVLSTSQRSALIRQVVDESVGLGVLEPLLADPTVTEVMVNGPDDVWVERDGKLERVAVRFTDEQQVMQAIDRIVSTVNRRVDESSPMVDARLPAGERVNVIIPPLSLTGPTITIRRFPQPFTMDRLIELETLDAATAELLATLVRARLSMVISGGTGAGKTTLLNALSGYIPPGERIITVEDSAELRLQQPHVISLESRPPNVEGKGEVTIRELVRNSLRMRPDRIIVGEVRGAETLDMLQAMNTGHEGSLCTVHANSAGDAIIRMETLSSMDESAIPFAALRDQVNSAVSVIIQLERGADGRRRVVEVAVVASRRREDFRLATVARFDADPITADRTITGQFRHFALPAWLLRRIELVGERPPDQFAAGASPHAPEREAE